jgi:hypothetical protein
VLVYFDQFRGDYLARWESLYGPDGFRRLTRDGAWFQNCHYPYACTLTAVGHASVVTGCSPETHGIVANEWYDPAAHAEVYCVGTERYDRLPPRPPPDPMADKTATGERKKRARASSPERLLAPNVADVLKEATKGRGRVVALSSKDRSAVLPAGRRPDACYWFDYDDGLFVTSTYYRDRLHPWVESFNAARPADRWWGSSWARSRPDLDYARYSSRDDAPGEGKGISQGTTFPHPFDGGPKRLRPIYYEQVYTSPHGNDLLLDLAKAAIDAEHLGQDEIPDLLSLSFSANDAVGHAWGPDSQEVLDVTLESDRIIKELLAFLDDRVGKGRYLLVLTADHGICPLPEASRAEGRAALRVSPTIFKAKATEFLTRAFGGNEKTAWVESVQGPWVYLNRRVARQYGVEPAVAAEALARWLPQVEGIQSARTPANAAAASDELSLAVRRATYPGRSGDVFAVVEPYSLVYGLTGTTHGTPHAYDTHVPLVVYGPGVRPGARHDRVTPQAAAAVLARALGLPSPPKADVGVPAGLFVDEAK